MDDPDVEVRLSAAHAAAELRLAEASEKAVTWLNDTEKRVRLAAAELFRVVPSERAVSPLGRLLGDPDAAVRRAAAAALGASRSADATLPLLGHLDRCDVAGAAKLGRRAVTDVADHRNRLLAPDQRLVAIAERFRANALQPLENDVAKREADRGIFGILKEAGCTLDAPFDFEARSRRLGRARLGPGDLLARRRRGRRNGLRGRRWCPENRRNRQQSA